LAYVNFEFAKLQHANFSGADLSNADFAGADDRLVLCLHGAETSKDLGWMRGMPQPLARRRENRVPNRRRNSAAISAAKRGSLICSGMRTRRRELV
jgi:Pentapeptide repeats (8 copies)